MADTLLDRLLPDGTLALDEVRITDDELPGRRQGVHRGLRQQLPRRPDGQVRHRALGPAAGGDRHRQRVPLPRPGARRPHPGHRGQPVGRDDRHPPGRRGRPAARTPRCWSSPTWSTRRWPARPMPCSTPGPARRSGWRPPRPTWPRSPPSRSWPSTWPRPGAPWHPAEARDLFDAMRALPDKVAAALERAGRGGGGGRAAYRDSPVVHLPRAPRRLPGGPRGGAQAEGALLPAGRGIPGRRAEARPHRPGRAGDGGHRGGHPHAACGRR